MEQSIENEIVMKDFNISFQDSNFSRVLSTKSQIKLKRSIFTNELRSCNVFSMSLFSPSLLASQINLGARVLFVPVAMRARDMLLHFYWLFLCFFTPLEQQIFSSATRKSSLQLLGFYWLTSTSSWSVESCQVK